MSAAIVVQGLSKRFGSKIALDNVSLEIPQGVVFAILGENGAGKSTLIRSLMGYHQTNQGSVRILGLDPARQHVEIRRRVGYVSDMPALFDWMKVAQIAWFTSGFYPEGYAERFAKWGDDFKLPLNVRIRSLSKGMKAKVALALTLAADPDVLILDEPTSGLDPVVRRDFMEAMVDLASRGKTVLLSSHQVHEVERVADHIAILSEGTLKICDRLETLKESVRLVTFTLRDPLAVPPDAILDLKPLRQTIRMRQVQYVLRDASESESLAEKLRGNVAVTDLQIVRPSLEDLYMAFTQGSEKMPWEENSASNSKHRVA